ncbi:hypothetical protein EJB05_44389, partial [Eragrostis curvula]
MDGTPPPPAPPSAPAPAAPPAPPSPRAPHSAPPHAPRIKLDSPCPGQAWRAEQEEARGSFSFGITLGAKGKKRSAPSASAHAKPSAKAVQNGKRKKRKTALSPFLGAALKFHEEDDVELTAAGEGA